MKESEKTINIKDLDESLYMKYNKNKQTNKVFYSLSLFVVLICSIVFSIIFSGSKKTFFNVILLLLSIIIGYGFIYVMYLITNLIFKKRINDKKKEELSEDIDREKLDEIIEKNNFTYNLEYGLSDNLHDFYYVCGVILNSVHELVKGKDSKYYYLDFYAVDGISMLIDVITETDTKIRENLSYVPYLGGRILDIPIGFTTFFLKNHDKKDETENKKKRIGVRIRDRAILSTVHLLQSPINSAVNGILVYFTSKAFLLYRGDYFLFVDEEGDKDGQF